MEMFKFDRGKQNAVRNKAESTAGGQFAGNTASKIDAGYE
jgi:hypothetical protein